MYFFIVIVLVNTDNILIDTLEPVLLLDGNFSIAKISVYFYF